MRIFLSRPDITDREIQAVTDVLKSPNLSLGPKLGEFEQAFAKYIGKKRAVAVNSGTSGLYLCMLALGIGPGDEVITTPFTFISTSNVVLMVGAKPVFVDIDPVTLTSTRIKSNKRLQKKQRRLFPLRPLGVLPASISFAVLQTSTKSHLSRIAAKPLVPS
jgi:perosamine synthetase